MSPLERTIRAAVATACLALAGGPAVAAGAPIVGLITKTDTNPFFVKMRVGAKARAGELGVEPCNRYETHLVNTMADAVEIIGRIGADNVFVHPDGYHMNIEEVGMARGIADAGGHPGYVHASEANRGVPGRGCLVTEAVGVEAAVERVLAALPPDAASRGRRFLLGIAGPPAAGKSTLAAALRDALNRGRGPGGNSESGDGDEDRSEVAAIAGLDGFHYDDRVLLARGHLPRKGAPFTFDAAGYAAMLERLAAPSREAVAIPVFDRELELSRAAAAVVEPCHRIVITEGNYLLLADDGWRRVRDRLDLSVFLDVPPEELRRRLMARWLGHGYGPAEAKEKTEANDLVNARLVMETSAAPDLRLHAPG